MYGWRTAWALLFATSAESLGFNEDKKMGDNGFSTFKAPEPSPFRLFAQDCFLPAFGNSNASASSETGTQARSATEPDESGASECERCGGSKLVTIFNFDGNGSDADDQPCPVCVDA